MPATSEPRIRTLGLRTDLSIERERSIVTEHRGFVAVRTPCNPGYHFGNSLIFDRAPQSGDEQRWPQLFEAVFAGDPQVRHAAFAWSEDDGEVHGFLARKYTQQRRAVLTASTVRTFELPAGLHVRELHGDEDWHAQYELGMATREAVYEEAGYTQFKAAQVAYHRAIAERFGMWLGTFDGARLVGSCGIFAAGDGNARYRDVGVLPAYRNRGIARALVSAAGRLAIERFGAKRLVIVAEADDFPRRIYERCGFTLLERERALWISAREQPRT
jgi:GNAT superfamily N-acetyltransferase